jgi:hypothetical protein
MGFRDSHHDPLHPGIIQIEMAGRAAPHANNAKQTRLATVLLSDGIDSSACANSLR